MNKIIKRVSEKKTIEIDYTGVEPVASGATIGSATVAGFLNNISDNSILTSTNATISGNVVSAQAIAGTNGNNYEIIFTVNFAGGSSDVDQPKVFMKVRD